MWLDLHIAPSKDITLAYKAFTTGPGWYWFKMIDDGYNISVWCNPEGNFTGPPDLEGVADHNFDLNYVTFYGRGYQSSTDHSMYFDDITVAIPEPTASLLLTAGFALIRRRSVCARACRTPRRPR